MKKILILNSGSATLKFKIYCCSPASPDQPVEILAGIFERIGLSNSWLSIEEFAKKSLIRQTFPQGVSDHDQALDLIFRRLEKYCPEIKLAGHRVVHGGEQFQSVTKLNEKVISQLSHYNQLAPLHNPVNLRCATKAMALLPQARHYAVFDTAYYQTIPDYAYLYALPKKFYEDYGIRRYGFHGISHQYAVEEAAKKVKKNLKKLRIITCHLGGGNSVTATKFGQAVETSMGFTPLEGLTMATRSGDLDPMVILFLIEKVGLSPAEVNRLVNQESGLLAITGTKDFREILAAAGQPVVGEVKHKKFTSEERIQANLALKIFIYDIVRYVGQMIAVMGGLDLLVFTGGIGENSPVARRLITKEIRKIFKFKTMVIPANEELMMARQINSLFRR